MHRREGVTLIELMVAVTILVVVLAGTFTLLVNQTKTSYKESAKTRSIQTNIISDLIIIRDITMAGLGMPKLVSGTFVPINISNNAGLNGSDELSIKGTAISSGTKDYLKWAYNTSYINSATINISSTPEPGAPTTEYPTNLFDFEADDRVIFLNAETKDLLSNTVYILNSATSNQIVLASAPDFTRPEKGALIFSLGGISVNDFSTYINTFSGYKLESHNTQSICAPGTYPLRRFYGTASPWLHPPVWDCVLDFQVEFGYTQSGNVSWLNSIPDPNGNYPELARIHIVTQQGKKDPRYTYPTTSITTADNTINLTSEQRHYHWRTIRLDVPLREVE